MTSIGTEELVAISRRIAQQIDSRLHIEGVTSADGGGGRAELLVSITGCHNDPCSLVLNLDRSDYAHVEHELTTKLSAAIAQHVSR